MPFIEIEVDGEVVSRRESTFGNEDFNKQVADAVNRRNVKVVQTSRQKRKGKARGN